MSSIVLLIYHNGVRIDFIDCPNGMIPIVGDTIILHNYQKYRVATRTIDFATHEIVITVESL
jgi:uncharacterized protein YigE (DUF2233 family)